MTTSTLPAAVTTLQGYLAAVAAATTVTDVGVYVGYSTALTGMNDNFMMVGDYEEGILWTPAETGWASMGVAAKRRTEKYALQGCIRCWAGGNDWQSRMNDAFSLLDALEEQIVSDPGGSGNLTPSGAWGQFNHRLVANGPLSKTGGWGLVIGFELHVINAQTNT